MKLSAEEINTWSPLFLREFVYHLNEMVGDKWDIRYKIFRPSQESREENVDGIDKNTLLVLWGDEQSQIFPEKYHQHAGAIIKCYCPEKWMKRGIIPITDAAMLYNSNAPIPKPCSQREYTIMYSANLNYRRTDIYRGLAACNYGYPFRVSSNYPITGEYPFLHKVEAVLVHKIITRFAKKIDFSDLYPNSYIRFHRGFMQGSLTEEEYSHRLLNSKISWCTPGFMTNETSRLLEAAQAGCAIICGKLPNNPIYQGHPFVVTSDWRNIRKLTDELLNDEARMDELGYLAREWFDNRFSPLAQAKRIANTLSGK